MIFGPFLGSGNLWVRINLSIWPKDPDNQIMDNNAKAYNATNKLQILKYTKLTSNSMILRKTKDQQADCAQNKKIYQVQAKEQETSIYNKFIPETDVN